ncbi:proline-rich receptor-like protein kinase PERK9 [Mauremys mutica]|uniref:proline-rich receptor-like protein kinase PERK9 n=1 Tax=Mauremys mutica TaxID=74926 RepID=UPI001D160C60|nr:proline-rich receptor-like protein kinase PERK9 [Mauremys mutica]
MRFGGLRGKPGEGAAASSSHIPKPTERDPTTRGSRRHAPQLPVDRPAISLPPDKPPDTHQQPQPEKPLPDDQKLQGADWTAERQLLQKDHPPPLEEPTALRWLIPAGASSCPPQLPEETPTDQLLLPMATRSLPSRERAAPDPARPDRRSLQPQETPPLSSCAHRTHPLHPRSPSRCEMTPPSSYGRRTRLLHPSNPCRRGTTTLTPYRTPTPPRNPSHREEPQVLPRHSHC